MKARTFLAVLIIGGLGGVIASNFAFPYLVRVNFLNTASILGKFINQPQVITKVEEKIVYVPRSEYFSNAVVSAKDSIVAIQSFEKQKLTRSGSGVILTRDGLIISANYAAPVDSELIQTVLNGQVITAKPVLRDKISGLVLLSAPGMNFQVARLETGMPELGRELMIFSRFVDQGKDGPAIINTFVTQLKNNNSGFKISAQFDPGLYGSALINSEGAVLGIVTSINNKTEVVSAQKIYDFLNGYLASTVK